MTFEEISAILQTIYLSLTGYSIKWTKQFLKKPGIFCRTFQDHVQLRTCLSKLFFRLKLSANVYHCPGKLNVCNDASGVMVNCRTDSCLSSSSTLNPFSSSVSIIDLKFFAPSNQSDASKSCAMNTISGTSYKKKIKLIWILEQNIVKVCSYWIL